MEINDTGLAAQQALYMQRMGVAMMKHAADTGKRVADIIEKTVTASNRGRNVDLRA